MQEIYRIERVLKRGKHRVFVKWKGYSSAFNSWIPQADVVQLMNINAQYAWQTGNNNNSRENSPAFPRNYVERVDVGRQQSSPSSCYNPTGWITSSRKSLHQQEYKVLRKGFEAGSIKQQVSNVFANQEALHAANISPLTAIDTFRGVRSGKIKADFHDDCQDIPDTSTLDPMQKKLLLLEDCFLGRQNKAEAYYTRRRHNCDTIYIAQNYFRLPRHIVRENSNFIILFPKDVKNLTHIHDGRYASDISLAAEFKQFCHRIWSDAHNFVTIDLTSTPMNGKSIDSISLVNCK